MSEENKEKFVAYIQSLQLPDLEITETLVNHTKTKKILAKITKDKIEVFPVRYDESLDEYIQRYSHLQSIIFKKEFDFSLILHNELKISYWSIINEILSLTGKQIKKIEINKKNNELRFYGKTFHISENKLKSLINTAKSIYDKSTSYGNSIRRHLINQELANFKGKPKSNTTSLLKGDMSFHIHRLNIDNKSKKEDFKKYLNENDIHSLQELCEKLIKFEVFNNDFIRGLDEYFIKEKLKEIVSLGREILELGSDDIKTAKAKKVISKLAVKNNEIKQMETIWQVFFEKYLLYLIFSYRKIYPKVKFEVETEKKYPDFLGINHYFGVDIIEIKHHLLPALMWDSSHKNYAFSGDLSKAIIQVMNYMDALIQEKFKNDGAETDIQNQLKLSILNKNIHRPRAIIIISSKDKLARERGSQSNTSKIIERDFTKLRNSLNNIEILTFDEILNTAEFYSTNIFNKPF